MSQLKQKKISEDRLAALPIIGDQPKSEKEEKFLREIGEFEFYNIEESGAPHGFTYGDTRTNYKFTMYHGTKYRVPRFIARHIETRITPQYKWRPDGKGSLEKTKVGNKPRFSMNQVFN